MRLIIDGTQSVRIVITTSGRPVFADLLRAISQDIPYREVYLQHADGRLQVLELNERIYQDDTFFISTIAKAA